MVEKKIQFNIVVGGIPQVRSSLKGVTDSARAMNLSIQQMHERTAQRVVEIERNKLSAIKRINDSQVGDEQSKLRRIAQLEENAARQITSIKEREALRVKHMNEKFISDAQADATRLQSINLSAMGHMAQAMGFYKTGHLLRMAGQLGIGSEVKKGGGGGGGGLQLGKLLAEGAEGGEGAAAGAAAGEAGGAAAAAGGLGALAAAALPLVAALGAVYVAAKVVETGFEVVSTQAKYLANSFIGAISQIGGARNLQEMIVESAEKEQAVKATRFTVLPEERLSEGELAARAAALSKRADLGAPTSKEGIEAQRLIGTLTGMQKSISQSTLEFIAKMAHVGNMPLSETAEIYGRVRAQNPRANDNEIRQLFLDAMAVGQKGAFGIKDIPQATQLIQAGSKLAGDQIQNTRTAFTVGTILRPQAGGLEQSGVQFDAFIRQAELAYVEGKLQPNLAKYFNKKGQITDVESLTGEIVSQTATQRARPFARAESQDYLTNIAKRAGITDTDTVEQQKEKVKELFAQYDEATMTMQQFDQANKDSVGTTDKLKATFNNLADQLEKGLLDILKVYEPDLMAFGQAIVENKGLIVEAIKEMIAAMISLVPVAGFVAGVLARLGIVFGLFMQAVAVLGDTMTGGLLHDKFEAIRQAGDHVAQSQAALALTIDNVSEAFDRLKAKLEQTPTPEPGGTTITIPEIKIVGDPHKEVVRAIEDMHHDLKIQKQPL